MISPNVILIWGGTHASIPAGWERVTSLDAKYPKAWGDEAPDVTNGSNTHTHSSTTHGHVMNSHSHNVVLTHTSGPPSASNRNDTCADNHGHVSHAIAGKSGGSLANTAVTWGSVNQEPPYYEVIFIQPSGGYVPIADDMLLHWNEASPPDGFYHCDGNNDTPDLRDKYLKGAATSGDSGGTGGALSHQHSITHTHTPNSHSHSAKSGLRDNSGNRGIPGSLVGSTQSHRHTTYLNATSPGINSYTKTDAGSGDTVEVAYKKIGTIKNTSGGGKIPLKGMIGMWLGALADVPLGWVVCDGTQDTPDLRNKFLKIINTTGQLGDTGGNNSHQHSSVSHTHTATGTHSHSGSTAGPDASLSTDTGGDGYAKSDHTHALTSVSSSTPTFQNTNVDCGNTDHQPAYRTVAYIMFKYFAAGGVLLGLV